MLFGSLYANIELPEKIPSITLNVFSKTLSEVYWKRSCMVEYTLGSVSIFAELPEKIPSVILKVR